jgi:predicted metal-binding membrane protein
MEPAQNIGSALRRDRIIVLTALTGIAVVAWVWMIHEARTMEATGICECAGIAMCGPDVKPWSAIVILPLFLMWAGMMVAMMTPTVAPMILTFAMINRKRREQARPFVSTALFLSGYLIVWTAFSLIAALAQWVLHGTALLSPMMQSASSWLGGLLLIMAGVFQWTPLKQACLSHCRSPLQFIMTDWRDGSVGALTMGLKHGAFCTGCCWMLMALLFVAGVMNMVWVAVITLLVFLEKVTPPDWRLRHLAGAYFLVWGAWVIVSGAAY